MLRGFDMNKKQFEALLGYIDECIELHSRKDELYSYKFDEKRVELINKALLDAFPGNNEKHNHKEYYGEGYLSRPKNRATVTVTFEVPDSVFERTPVPIIEGVIEPTTPADGEDAAAE